MEPGALHITLLGGFGVEARGARVDDRAWRLRKARSLVKLLALAPGRRLHRDVVAETLWPDRDAASAANNLHQALHAARRALGDPRAVVLADEAVALDPGTWIDLAAFEEAAAAARAAGDPELVRRALDLHTGELLPEDRFEEWTAARRDAVQDLYLDLCARSGDVPLLQAAVAAAPLHEPARRALMLALAGDGRRQDALAQFEALRRELRAELAADPDPETRAVYRELLRTGAPGTGAGDGRGRRPSLPPALTTFVGRARELAELARMLDRMRLLTLTGPGGVGKTRLAIEAARARAPGTPDGVWLVDLGVLHDPALVPQAVATALELPIPANRPATDALIAHLAPRTTLLVLDTCEHLLDAVAPLAETLLATAPALRIVATSREPLRCAGEVAWRVPSLAEAPALFHDRAAAVRIEPFSAEEAALVDEICWRLDGMPLAVELAAARTGALTPAQIAARLGDSLDMLSAGSRTALTRQQTLRATIAWSHELLTGDERVVFRRLSAFAGPFALEAAEAVAAGDAIPARRVADLVARLVEKSLLAGEGGRFRLTDPIRQFAAEQLAAAGEREAVARRHLDWALALARGQEATAPGALEHDHDDLRAALAHALHVDPEAALRLAAGLWRFWLAHSWFVEGTRWMDAALAAAPARTALRVEVLLAVAGLALRRGDPDAYHARVDEAVAILTELDDSRATAEASVQSAMFEEYHRGSARSAALSLQAVAIAERLGEERVAAGALHAASVSPWYRGDLDAAHELLVTALARLRALPRGPERFVQGIVYGQPVLPLGHDGGPRPVWEATIVQFRRLDRDGGIALALGNLAWLQRVAGDLDSAAAALDEAADAAAASGEAASAPLVLAHRGHLARARGDLDAARELLNDAAARLAELGERRDATVTTLGLAFVHQAAGDLPAAHAVLAAALERFQATDDLPAVASTLMNWAAVEERAGDLAAARERYAAAARAWTAQGLRRFAAWMLLGEGSVALALGDADGAARSLREARDGFAEAGHRGALAETARLLALSGR